MQTKHIKLRIIKTLFDENYKQEDFLSETTHQKNFQWQFSKAAVFKGNMHCIKKQLKIKRIYLQILGRVYQLL